MKQQKVFRAMGLILLAIFLMGCPTNTTVNVAKDDSVCFYPLGETVVTDTRVIERELVRWVTPPPAEKLREVVPTPASSVSSVGPISPTPTARPSMGLFPSPRPSKAAHFIGGFNGNPPFPHSSPPRHGKTTR